MQEETEILPIHLSDLMCMQNEDYIITKEQANALSPMGEAFMYQVEAWWRVEDNDSLYQNVRMPEGYMQVELKTDGTVIKYPDKQALKRKEHHESTAQALSFVLSLLTDEQEAAYREYLGVSE